MTSYRAFYKEEWPRVKRDCPEMKTTDVTKEIGARWQEIKASPSKLKKYEKLAQGAHGETPAAEEKASKAAPAEENTTQDDPPLTPFQLFSMSRRAALEKENSGMSQKEITKELEKEYKNLPKELKRQYKKLVKEAN